ncbi:nickel-responsive transcriptional regulator NikR [Natronoflexus pectinivorans]|uniref:Putative nickel-responsive regulator n=1 Tax=Natronoflexus pectinivorans TaxID=682526 RepID=A0A4R2GCC1_9BACT|nr:nickel-responsive transcriptional regulator NikR [Natronoflexus pectinivorans]TCO05411.1 CopG family nickel-responsive transcriptional regulator [Natronoflexus pectinivorans]
MSVVRFGVSLEKELLDDLDEFVKKNRFTNRSQAIRQLIAENTARSKWECNNIVVGSITLIYDHHKRELVHKLHDIQHHYHHEILSSQHFHLNHDICMEIIAVKGEAKLLTELSDKLIAIKGIQHGKLTMSRA